MKSLHIAYDPSSRSIDTIPDASPESWDAVCERFDYDVKRIRTVSDRDAYTALYACYDEDNQPVYYLVEEDATLMNLRRKTFLSKLGQLKS